MRFSIIVTAYNIKNYIRNCVESLINQTYKNFEIIIIDDYSNDSTEKICDRYASQYDNIRVIHHKKNLGVVCARKTGIKYSLGEYLVFVDGDDYLSELYLEKINKAISNSDDVVDLVCCNFIRHYENKDDIIFEDFKDEIFNRSKIEKNILPKLILDKYGKTFPQTVWAKAFRRDLIKFNQGSNDNGMRYSEDKAMVCPFVYHSNVVITISDALYYYRINDQSSTRVKKPLPWKDVYSFNEHIIQNIPLNEYDFYEQMCRYMSYLIFIVSSTQYNLNESPQVIKKSIKKRLIDPKLSKYIQNAKFLTRNGMIIRFALKYRLYGLMKKYNKTR